MRAEEVQIHRNWVSVKIYRLAKEIQSPVLVRKGLQKPLS
jgi:hypothetical protein